jgi:hypothetical protein
MIDLLGIKTTLPHNNKTYEETWETSRASNVSSKPSPRIWEWAPMRSILVKSFVSDTFTSAISRSGVQSKNGTETQVCKDHTSVLGQGYRTDIHQTALSPSNHIPLHLHFSWPLSPLPSFTEHLPVVETLNRYSKQKRTLFSMTRFCWWFASSS